MSDSATVFVDSNIWLYSLLETSDESKSHVATVLLENESLEIVISTQVVNEITNNLLRKANAPEPEVRFVIDDLYRLRQVIPLDQHIQTLASVLRERYQFSHYDGLIVSAALASGASILYTEDMHNGLVIEDKLTIVNPFIPAD